MNLGKAVLYPNMLSCHFVFSIISNATMSDNKLVKTIMAGIGWIAKKVVKENFTCDPSVSAMNYVKFTTIMADSIALK